MNDYAYTNPLVRLLARLVDALGYGLTFWQRRNRPVDAHRIFKILIIKLDHLGDCFLMTPLLECLAQLFPGVRIDVLCQEVTRPVFENHPRVSEIITYNYSRAWRGGGRRAGWLETLRLFRLVRSRRYSLAIDPRGEPLAALLGLWSGARYRIGFEREEVGGFLYTYLLRYDPAAHETERYRVILGALQAGSYKTHTSYRSYTTNKTDRTPRQGSGQADTTDFGKEWQPRIYLTPEETEKIQALIARELPGPFWAVHPGSGVPYKQWPAEYFAQAIRQLLPQNNFEFVLLGGQSDQKICAAIKDQVNSERVKILAGELDLRETYGLLSLARGFLGNDSVLAHMSGALGVPTIEIMSGMVLQSRWRALGPKVKVLVGRDPAHACNLGGCYPCPHLRAVTAAAVISELAELGLRQIP
ncbi:MAG: glycosyltransferase family 9 protein [Candidatus Liptonbacteria bacterium]|nr:glycosyltransferase family 9 protein [Candidatus Liptonbacteria bacterium]